ncbi:MAG TPA: VOC family protein [Candidatus Saccharimonadales bacterium]
MLANLSAYAVIPVSDLQRARTFYSEKLGLEPKKEMPGGLIYETGDSTEFLMYETENAGTAKNTAMGWECDDVESEVEELRGRGVVFEEYDMPGIKTENGIATTDGQQAAWFKDSEGNILAISSAAAQ